MAKLIVNPIKNEKYAKGKGKGLFSRFFYLIVPHKQLLTGIIVAALLLTIFGILGSFYYKYLIDDIIPDGLLSTLAVVSIGFLTLHLFRIILGFCRSQLLIYLSNKVDVRLIMDFYQHIIQLPVAFFDTHQIGDVLSRIQDNSKIRAAISGATISFIIDTLLVAVGIGVLLTQNWLLFLVKLVTIPLYITIILSFKNPYNQLNALIMEIGGLIQSNAVEAYTGNMTLKAFNAEAMFQNDFENKFVRQVKTASKLGMLSNLQSALQEGLNSLGDLIFLWVGAVQIVKGNLTLGQLLTFNALVGYFLEPLKNLFHLQLSLQEGMVAANRVSEIIDLDVEEPNKEEKVSFKNFKGRIQLKNVSFGYRAGQLVLKNIDLEIKPGEKIALVGKSGSGKSTLVKLLLKFYEAQQGEILIDGYNIRDLLAENLRNRIGYVPQEIPLFTGTVWDNITLGRPDLSMEEVVKVATQAKAQEFINYLPRRYNTVINNTALSGGQKQRIGIARAILGKPDLLILDEATSNLDSATEKAIHYTLDSISKGLTAIIIAHRLSTIQSCDRIVVIDDGKIVESGTHVQLTERRGKYYQLWKGQFGDNMDLGE